MTPNDSHGNPTHPGQLFVNNPTNAASEHHAAEASDVALIAGIMILAIAALGILPLLKP